MTTPMLLSYALDAGKGGIGTGRARRALARPHADQPSRTSPAAAEARSPSTACRSTGRPNTPPRTPTSRSACGLALKPRLVAEHMTNALRDAGAAAGAGAGADGGARHQGRPPDPVAPVRRVRAEARRARGRDLQARRRELQHRLAEAARRHPVRQVRPARRQEDQDRRLVDRRRRARRARRRRQRARRPHPRLAPAVQAEVDLHRPPARLHPPRDRPRPHLTMRSPRPPPAGSPPPSRTCRTSRSAPRTAGASAPPSSPRRG